jgi:hypothetical protein
MTSHRISSEIHAYVVNARRQIGPATPISLRMTSIGTGLKLANAYGVFVGIVFRR